MLGGLGAGQSLLGDRAYDNDALRTRMAEQGAWANAKPMPNRKQSLAFSPFLHKYRNLVERFFSNIENFHAIATRYDKDPDNFLADRAYDAAAGGSDEWLNGDNPDGGMLFREASFAVVDVLRAVAKETGRPMAQVALAWVARRPGISSVLVGASCPKQFVQNIASLDVSLSPKQQGRLDAAGRPPSLNAHFVVDLPMPTTSEAESRGLAGLSGVLTSPNS